MRLGHVLMLGLISLPLACAAQAASLAEEIDEIRQVDRELDARGGAAHAPQLAGRSARLRQAAIDHAIVAYAIDVRALPTGVHYSPHGGMRERDGATFLDRDGTLRVQIGDQAFRSAGWLASTIAQSGKDMKKYLGRIADLCRTLAIGIVILEKADNNTKARLTLRVDECVSCAGLSGAKAPICNFEAGLVGGVVKAFVARDVKAIETRCNAVGDRTCGIDVEVLGGSR